MVTRSLVYQKHFSTPATICVSSGHCSLSSKGALLIGNRNQQRRKHMPREPLNHSARPRRRIGEKLRLGLGKCGLAMIECFCPNEHAQTRRRSGKGPSHMGFAGKDAAHARHHEAAAAATVTRAAAHNLRLYRAKLAPRRVIQRFPRSSQHGLSAHMGVSLSNVFIPSQSQATGETYALSRN